MSFSFTFIVGVAGLAACWPVPCSAFTLLTRLPERTFRRLVAMLLIVFGVAMLIGPIA